MNIQELIKLKYSLECMRDREDNYKKNKYYAVVNPSNIIYIGNGIASLFRLERDLDTNGFVELFERVQEDFIRDSVASYLKFDELGIKIYYLLLVDRLELEMIKKDCEFENKSEKDIPRNLEFLNDVVIVGRVDFELYNNGNKIAVRSIKSKEDGHENIISYQSFKNEVTKLGYTGFRIGDFSDLINSVYDSRTSQEFLSITFRKNKTKIRESK